jgi:uncharacterized repeat protein (TIGR01451 family)
MCRKNALSIGLALILLGIVAAVTGGVFADAERIPAGLSTPTGIHSVTFQQGIHGYAGCEDTRISAENPDQNFGEQELVLGMKGRANVLIRFDVSSIPANATIVDAALEIWVYNYGQRMGPITAAAYQVIRSWEEMEATWIKAAADDQWEEAGCNDTISDRSGTALGSDTIYERDRWYSWTITSAVQEWVQDPVSNMGILLQQTNVEEGGEYDARCSECPMAPRLVVKYAFLPEIAVSKEPPSATAEVCDAIAFTLRIHNTGATTITDLTLTDSYDSNFLSFVDSSEVPDCQVAGKITWDELHPFLPLAPGEAFDLMVNFLATAPTEATTNTVTAQGVDELGQPAPPAEDHAEVHIEPAAPPEITVSKEPQTISAEVSDSIPFTLRITNTGPTTIESLTVADTYDGDFLSFIASSEVPDEHAPGMITWNTLDPFLPLAPGEGFALSVNFQAAAATEATTNTVTVHGADECGQPVGPEEDHARVEITPHDGPVYHLYWPLMFVPTTVCTEVSYCCSAGDPMYRIAASDFAPYTCQYARNCPLILATEPPAPSGWNQVGFVPAGSWRPASLVWWGAWDGWAPTPEECKPIGLPGPEGKDGTTHLHRQSLGLTPPAPGMCITKAVLEMWSDNRSAWWWQGEMVASNREGFAGRVAVSADECGGTHLLAIQNSNDYASKGGDNPHGTACRLVVTWCSCVAACPP